VTSVRNLRKKNSLPARDQLELFVSKKSSGKEKSFENLIKRLAKVTAITELESKPDNSASFIIGTSEYYILMGDSIDVATEIEKLKAELEYNRGFLRSVMKKLDNERFVSNAPSKVIELEEKKKADAETRIRTLVEQLEDLQQKR
jgi:valyl-tRNA synthetase